MKKNKLFVALSCLGLILGGLIGCGKSEPATSQVPSDHKHKYGDWTVVTPATCETAGQEKQVCECGDEKVREIKALGHEWDEGVITTPATCTTEGVKTFTCKREGCGKTKTEKIIADHVWGEASEVAAPKTGVGLAKNNKSVCTVCNKTYKLEIAANQGKVTGSLKKESRFPDYIKFSNKNDYTTLTFNYNAPAKGQIYLRGVMDYWHDGNNENQKREGFYAGKSNTDGNFRLTVNGEDVDYSWSKGLTYADMFPEEGQEGNFSQLADCRVGEVELVAGRNTIVYERLESYNLLVKDFVLIVENTGEEIVLEEGYDVNFTNTHSKLYIFQAGQDYGVAPVEGNYAESMDDNGVPCKWSEERETAGLLPQVNFKVVCDEGYEVDADDVEIKEEGMYNKIKVVSNDPEENSWILRITKIKSDLNVTITPKEVVEGAINGHDVTFALTNCTVKVYVGPKTVTEGEAVVDTGVDGIFYTRSNKAPYDYTKTEGQLNFEIIPNAGYEFKDGIEWPENGEVSSSDVSFVSPSSKYNKLKKLDDGSYRVTKVAGSLTITIVATAIGA